MRLVQEPYYRDDAICPPSERHLWNNNNNAEVIHLPLADITYITDWLSHLYIASTQAVAGLVQIRPSTIASVNVHRSNGNITASRHHRERFDSSLFHQITFPNERSISTSASGVHRTMRPFGTQLMYGSKARAYLNRKSSITKSRAHLSKLRKLTLSAALSELWIGIAVQWRKDDVIDIAFACRSSTKFNETFIVHSVDVPQQKPSGLQSFMDPLSFDSNDAGELVCDHIVDAVRRFQNFNQYKYLGAGLSQEVVRLSPQLPARLWLDLDIVPITTAASESCASSDISGRSSISTTWSAIASSTPDSADSL